MTAVLTVALVAAVFSSLRRPVPMIQASLIRATPLGTPKEEVMRVIDGREWRHSGIRDVGFLKQEPGRATEVVGKHSIEAHLGEYRWIFVTSVDAFWGFDERGRLTDVWVWKTTDGL